MLIIYKGNNKCNNFLLTNKSLKHSYNLLFTLHKTHAMHLIKVTNLIKYCLYYLVQGTQFVKNKNSINIPEKERIIK